MGFIGLATYYKRFIKNFATIMKPLHRLVSETGDNTKRSRNLRLSWKTQHQEAFDRIKSLLLSECILALPDFTRPFLLDSDASNEGIGAVLSQLSPVKDATNCDTQWIERPVDFFSRTLNPAERNYSTTEKELLAIVAACEHYKFYLYGKHFTIRSDHQPLKFLMTTSQPAARLARWLIRLEQFDFEIEYRKGASHGNADGVSRLSVEDEDSGAIFTTLKILSMTST